VQLDVNMHISGKKLTACDGVPLAGPSRRQHVAAVFSQISISVSVGGRDQILTRSYSQVRHASTSITVKVVHRPCYEIFLRTSEIPGGRGGLRPAEYSQGAIDVAGISSIGAGASGVFEKHRIVIKTCAPAHLG